jgi:regulator of protease activity HflC (stomatin/prohibitin superfamily)
MNIQLDPATITLIVILSLVGFILLIWVLAGIKVIKEWERAPLLRLGRYLGLKGPGIFWYFRGFYTLPFVVSTRIQTYNFKSEQTLTKDNVSVSVDAIMYYRVLDPEKVVLEVEDYLTATQWAAQTTLREVMGKVELNELLSERDQISKHLQEIIDEKTEHWGVKVTSVEVRDVILPQVLVDVMARQAEAQRERQARVTLATAEAEASFKMVEAAKEYQTDPVAMQLRWMNLLYEAATQGKSTIILVPANVPTAGFASVLDSYGIDRLVEDAKKKTTAPSPQP